MALNTQLYLCAILLSCGISFFMTHWVRLLALEHGWVDAPSSKIKTHKIPTPCLGGVAMWFSFTATLVLLRLFTQFPTGTLHSLRAIVAGGCVVFLLGFIDDVSKPQGVHFKLKFAVQIAAALVLILFGIRMRFIQPDYLAMGLTILWVVGVTNAFNIIDIMDGLSVSQAAIAALAFLCISLPSEQIYVNFAAAALAGSALGFLPWNLSVSRKIFMGDSGSLFLGFVLAALSLGIDYSQKNPLGVYAPLLILLIPVYDTGFVMAARLIKGQSPFLGSKDHFALRLEAMGFSRGKVVLMAALAGLLASFGAFLVTLLSLFGAVSVYLVLAALIGLLSWRLYKIEMQ